METIVRDASKVKDERGGNAFLGLLRERGAIAEAVKGAAAWAERDALFRRAAEKVLGTEGFSVLSVKEEGSFRAYGRGLFSGSVGFSLGLWVFVKPEGDAEARGVRVCAFGSAALSDEGVKVLSLSYGMRDERGGVPLDGDLVPILPSDRYGSVARGMLERYLPGFSGGAPLDCGALAAAMGVGVCYHAIEKDGSVLGLASMREGEVWLYDPEKGRKAPYLLKGRSIVIDREAHGGSAARLKMTLAHEAVHEALHTRTYALRRLLGEEASFHRLAAGPVGEVPSWQRWAEIHAGGIAPSLLMPEEAFKERADSIYREIKKGGPVGPEGVERMVRSLASSFGVSVSAAKRRLVELGYERARGVCNYVDGRYVKPYSFRKGSLSPTETYEVRKEERILLTDAKGLFCAFFPYPTARFPYLFVDGHYAVDLPKYVVRGDRGEPALTDYALSHMDECCAKFDFPGARRAGTDGWGWDPVGKPFARLNMPSREVDRRQAVEDGLVEDLSLTSGTLAAMERARGREGRYLSLMEREGAETLGGVLRLLMETKGNERKEKDGKGLTVADVASLTGIDDSAIYRYLNGRTRPSAEYLIAVCVALELPPAVTGACLGRIGVSLEGAEDERSFYLGFVVNHMFLLPVESANEFLRSHGQRPLTPA